MNTITLKLPEIAARREPGREAGQDVSERGTSFSAQLEALTTEAKPDVPAKRLAHRRQAEQGESVRLERGGEDMLADPDEAPGDPALLALVIATDIPRAARAPVLTEGEGRAPAPEHRAPRVSDERPQSEAADDRTRSFRAEPPVWSSPRVIRDWSETTSPAATSEPTPHAEAEPTKSAQKSQAGAAAQVLAVLASPAPAAQTSSRALSEQPVRQVSSKPSPSENSDGRPKSTIQVSVLNRETHFAPVLRPAAPSAAEPTADPEALQGEQAASPPARRSEAAAASESIKTDKTPELPGAGNSEEQARLPSDQLARIAQAISADLPEDAPLSGIPREPVLASPLFASAPAHQSPVRRLQIQLHPETLGTVQVELTITDGELSVRLIADREETARMLEQDSGRVTELLRAAGREPEALTVHMAPPDRAAPHAAETHAAGGRDAAQTTLGGGNSAPSGRREEHDSQARRDTPNQHSEGSETNNAKTPLSPGARRGLYV